MKPLVFQTDFGLFDGAVSAMYGVAYTVKPDLRIHDLTHDITPFNIWKANYRLIQTINYRPEGAVFVSVVDPGVGSDRKRVVVKTNSGRYIVTTDNGTLTHVIRLEGIAEVRVKDISFMLGLMLAYIVLNHVLIFLFSPEHGTTLYGTKTELFNRFGSYMVTAEQLFYHLNVILKNACTIPIVLLFICTTNPSEFAVSLSSIGVSYRISYAAALALRFIPDIQREYRDISRAQQARGSEMSNKASLINRLKAASSILIPLILSSMAQIETISNAMELWGFSKGAKRTRYSGRKFPEMDFFMFGDISTQCKYFGSVQRAFCRR